LPHALHGLIILSLTLKSFLPEGFALLPMRAIHPKELMRCSCKLAKPAAQQEKIKRSLAGREGEIFIVC